MELSNSGTNILKSNKLPSKGISTSSPWKNIHTAVAKQTKPSANKFDQIVSAGNPYNLKVCSGKRYTGQSHCTR